MSAVNFDPERPETKRGIMLRFEESVQLLAASTDEQLAAFPASFEGIAFDIASDFEHWLEVVRTHYGEDLGARTRDYLHQIERALALVEERDLWTRKAMSESAEWEEIREASRSVAQEVGWGLKAPPKWD